MSLVILGRFVHLHEDDNRMTNETLFISDIKQQNDFDFMECCIAAFLLWNFDVDIRLSVKPNLIWSGGESGSQGFFNCWELSALAFWPFCFILLKQLCV